MLEAQRDMAWTQCDVARFFYLLLGRFASFGLVPRRVGGPTRHGALPTRRGALVLPPFGGIRFLGTRATSCWRPNASWRAPNATWRARFAPFLGVLVPLGSCHVVLEAQHDMAGSQYDVARSFAPFWAVLASLGWSHVALEVQRVMARSQYDMARSTLFLGDLDPLGSSHVVLEAQRVMAGFQCGVARSFCSLLGRFGAFGLEPRRVGGPIRRGRAQYNVTRLCLGTSIKKATSELSQRWQA